MFTSLVINTSFCLGTNVPINIIVSIFLNHAGFNLKIFTFSLQGSLNHLKTFMR